MRLFLEVEWINCRCTSTKVQAPTGPQHQPSVMLFWSSLHNSLTRCQEWIWHTYCNRRMKNACCGNKKPLWTSNWYIYFIPTCFIFHKEFDMKQSNRRLTSCLKLKRGGNGRPFGRRALGSRSSSKKGCVHASSCNSNQWEKLHIMHVVN